MFHTFDHARVPVPEDWRQDGVHVWDWIEINLPLSVFFVEATAPAGPRRSRRFIYVDLRACFEHKKAELLTIDRIYRLTSALESSSGEMMLERVTHVWTDRTNYVYEYRLANENVGGLEERPSIVEPYLVYHDIALQ